MALQMHAAVVEQFGAPLVLREWDVPSPGPGQIVVKTEACGVCHTDLHAARGDWPVKPTLPFIPGHEAIGLVSSVGAGVKIVKEGTGWRRALALFCMRSLRVLPESMGDGLPRGAVRRVHKKRGFAEYVLADPNYVAHIPAGLGCGCSAHHLRRHHHVLRESNKPKQSPVNGLLSLVSAVWDTWQFSMPRRWGYSSRHRYR